MFVRTSRSGQDWSKSSLVGLDPTQDHLISIPSALVSLHNNISPRVSKHRTSRETPFECFAECLCSAEFNLNDKQIGSRVLPEGIDRTNRLSRTTRNLIRELIAKTFVLLSFFARSKGLIKLLCVDGTEIVLLCNNTLFTVA